MRYRVAALLVAAAGLTAATVAAARSGNRLLPPAVAEPFGRLPAPTGLHTPATSCAAASCHNTGRVGAPGGEHSTWSAADPHRRAYEVLSNADSVRIMKNLAAGDPGRWAQPAHREGLCLKCHALDADRYYHGERLDDRGLGEGVGCDACHGPSQNWLSAHYQAGWKFLSDREKYERYGFAPTKDLVARSLTCAGCHVGRADREVNHDLIAAGHPRLSFEYARYHYQPNYTRHWTERLPNPAFELKAWLIGQAASLDSALDLLAARAELASRQAAPWPEFAELSCYACHQGVGGTPTRGSGGGRRDRPVGMAGWQVWYTALADGVLADAADVLAPGTQPTVPALKELRRVMQSPTPDPRTVAKLAAAAKLELDGWLARVQAAGYDAALAPGAAARLGAIVTASVLADDRSQLRDYDWDFLAQHALALTAAYHASGGAGGELAAWKPALTELRAKLAFPADATRRFDSPKDFNPQSVYGPFKYLYGKTHTAKGER